MEFTYTVTVRCATEKEAQIVMNERIFYTEDYGFEYEIDYQEPKVFQGLA
jgi:hypothetical protein